MIKLFKLYIIFGYHLFGISSEEVVVLDGIQVVLEEKEISVPVLTYDVCTYNDEMSSLKNYVAGSVIRTQKGIPIVFSALVMQEDDTASKSEACVSFITDCPVRFGNKYCLESICADSSLVSVNGNVGKKSGSVVDVNIENHRLFKARATDFTETTKKVQSSVYMTTQNVIDRPSLQRLISPSGDMRLGLGPSILELNTDVLLATTGIDVDATKLTNCHKLVGINVGQAIVVQRLWASACTSNNACTYEEAMDALQPISIESYDKLLQLEEETTNGVHYSIEKHLLCAIDSRWSTECYDDEDVFRHRIPRYVLRFWTTTSLLLLALPLVLLAWFSKKSSTIKKGEKSQKADRRHSDGQFVEKPCTRKIKRAAALIRLIAEIMILLAGAAIWYAYIWQRHFEDAFTFKDEYRQKWLRQPVYWGMSVSAAVHVFTALFVLADEVKVEPKFLFPLYLGATIIVGLNAKALYANYNVNTLEHISNNREFADKFGFSLAMRTWSSAYVFVAVRLLRAFCFCFTPNINMDAARCFALPIAIATIYPLSSQRIYTYWILPTFLLYCFLHDRFVMRFVRSFDCFYKYEPNEQTSEIYSRMSSTTSYEPAGNTLVKHSSRRLPRPSNCNKCWSFFTQNFFIHHEVIPRTECDDMSQRHSDDLVIPAAYNHQSSIPAPVNKSSLSRDYEDDELMKKACAMADATISPMSNASTQITSSNYHYLAASLSPASNSSDDESQLQIAYDLDDGNEISHSGDDDDEKLNVIDMSLPTRDNLEPISHIIKKKKVGATMDDDESKTGNFSDALFCGTLYGAV